MTVPRLYLDTNFFITVYETKMPESRDGWGLLERIERGAAQGVTSELTLAELLTKPLMDGAADLVVAYEAIIRDDAALTVVPVDRRILIMAAHKRAKQTSLKLPDAIHLASATAGARSHFLSSDRRIPLLAGLASLRPGTDVFAKFCSELS